MAEAATPKPKREGKTLATVVDDEFAEQVHLAVSISGQSLKAWMQDALRSHLVEVQPEIDAVLKARKAREARERKATTA